jgi:HEXXH motif-containing protein
MEAFLPELLFQMSVAGLISPQGISWSKPVSSLSFPQARAALLLEKSNEGLVFHSGRVQAVRHSEAFSLTNEGLGAPPEWISIQRSFTAVTGRGLLSTHDSNPLSDFEAHPDKEGNFVNLSERPEAEWVSSLKEALNRVEAGLPCLRAEMDLLMQQWIPVGFEPEMHLSASYQEAIGQAYLTLHPNNYTMMEAMVHEFQHNKVNALMHLDPLLENAFSPLFSSPVRPDPRPLHGVLLAVHAFIPVAELYRQLRAAGVPEVRQPDLKKRLKQIVKGNHEGMEVLREHGQWTEVGARFFAQLDALDNRHFVEECS